MPYNFHMTDCSTSWYGGKTYVNYTVAWTPAAGYYQWQVGQTTSNNPASAVIIKSGTRGSIAELTAYLVTSYPSIHYFWVRQTGIGGSSPTAWVALNENPVDHSEACLIL